ncbi:nucleotidyl transferase AbiEii/AbiGii toxin family protein [Rhizobium hidalgonense]|nr:nucleotidyl transferase AbiEii/AbiGii toxin family protein [Rhizobium hidalgonense]MDR9823576.1 nucleotidyl transferase AbiEii/AbiGii toxin family protein [Rhizobium hidalgonense]
MADPFLTLSKDDRREALAVAADRTGRPIHLLDKDVWVVRTLQTLFSSTLGEHLVFKGGTSLSKAYGVIKRFSEDVDLTYDIRALAPDLVGDNDEALPKTRSEEKRWTSEVRKRLPVWVSDTVEPVIASALRDQSLPAAIRLEDDTLYLNHEAVDVRWRDRGGPTVEALKRRGFGSRLIYSSLSAFGNVAVDYAPKELILSLDASLQSLQDQNCSDSPT